MSRNDCTRGGGRRSPSEASSSSRSTIGVRAHATLVVLAAVALGGCSSSSDGRLTKSEYEEHVRSVYAEVQQAFAATNVPATELADRVADAQAALRTAADALEEAEPPEEVVKENEEIVEGMREYAEDLDSLWHAADAGDQSAIDEFNSAVSDNDAVEQMAEAAEEMKFKGYDLGPIGEE